MRILSKLEALLLAAVDVFAFVLAGVMANTAFWLHMGRDPDAWTLIWQHSGAESRLLIYFAVLSIAIGWFASLGHYTRRRPFWDEAGELLRVVILLAIADAALQYLAKLTFSRFWFLATWGLFLLFVPILRLLWKRMLCSLGKWQRTTVIIGAGPNAHEAAAALYSEPMMGLDIVAFLTPNPKNIPSTGRTKVAGSEIETVLIEKGMLEELDRFNPRSVVLAPEQEDLVAAQEMVSQLNRKFDDLSVVPPFKGLPLYGMETNHFFRHEVLLLRLRNNLARRGPRAIKRLFDVVVVSGLLIALSPLFAYIAIRIRMSGSQVIFGHKRVGRGGRPFTCFKFCTMVPDAEAKLQELLARDPEAMAAWSKDFKLKNDPRITRFGALLRKTSLDELPQLWNVLKNDMSLVGPRPIIEEELVRYGNDREHYLQSKPGITGLWQISGRNDTDYKDRVYLDAWYTKNWSLWYDTVILIKTVGVVFGRVGAY